MPKKILNGPPKQDTKFIVRGMIGFELQAVSKRANLAFYAIFLSCGHVTDITLPIGSSPPVGNFACMKCHGGE